MMSRADHAAWLRRWDARMKAERASQAAAGDLAQQRLMEMLGETSPPERAATPRAVPPPPPKPLVPPATYTPPSAADLAFEEARASANARFEAERQQRLANEQAAAAILSFFSSERP